MLALFSWCYFAMTCAMRCSMLPGFTKTINADEAHGHGGPAIGSDAHKKAFGGAETLFCIPSPARRRGPRARGHSERRLEMPAAGQRLRDSLHSWPAEMAGPRSIGAAAQPYGRTQHSSPAWL